MVGRVAGKLESWSERGERESGKYKCEKGTQSKDTNETKRLPSVSRNW